MQIWEVSLVKSGRQQPYKMSFAVGGLHLNESLEVARLYDPSKTWEIAIVRALSEGIASLPKAASRRRTLREIVNRVSTLTPSEIAFLTEVADRAEQQAVLWLATCRAYRFVREFAVEVVQDRYLSYQLELPLESFDVLFAAKAEWNEELAGISHSTRLKLRQILFRIMREADIIAESNRIQKAYLSPRLRKLIEDRDPAELSIFPGMSAAGGGP